MTDKIVLFIPGYNCEKQIPRVIQQLDASICTVIDKVIFVNNRSTDGTEAAAIQALQELRGVSAEVLRNTENYGLGGSHKVAFDYAHREGFTHIIVLHGDDQGAIKDIYPLIKEGKHRQFDCLLGARFHPESSLQGYSKFRTYGNIVFNILFSLVGRMRFQDLGSGLNMYQTQALSSKFWFKFPDNLTFNYCMCMAASYYKQKCHFFPISWREDDQISNVKLTSQAFNVLKMLAQYCLAPKKFLTSEHREKIHSAYTAEIVFSTTEPKISS